MPSPSVIYEIYDAYATIACFKCKVAHHAATYPTHQEVTIIGWLTLHLKRVLWRSVSLRRVRNAIYSKIAHLKIPQ